MSRRDTYLFGVLQASDASDACERNCGGVGLSLYDNALSFSLMLRDGIRVGEAWLDADSGAAGVRIPLMRARSGSTVAPPLHGVIPLGHESVGAMLQTLRCGAMVLEVQTDAGLLRARIHEVPGARAAHRYGVRPRR
jgi:hypothetical protein